MSSISGPFLSGKTYILDSWPFLERELKGTLLPQIEHLIGAAALRDVRLLISEMNLGEVFYLLAKRRGEDQAEGWIEVARRSPMEVIPVASDQLWAAARLKARTTLSYSDCFCAVLAMAHGAPVVTGDPDFLQLRDKGEIAVEWLGE